MKNVTKSILPIILSAIWISISEFFRNEFLFKSYWIEHYQRLGIIFPSEPLNGAIWGIWSLFLAIVIYLISRKNSPFKTTLIVWTACFVMMWIVLGNLNVLPFSLLYWAIPLSMIEVYIAVIITEKLSE